MTGYYDMHMVLYHTRLWVYTALTLRTNTCIVHKGIIPFMLEPKRCINHYYKPCLSSQARDKKLNEKTKFITIV